MQVCARVFMLILADVWPRCGRGCSNHRYLAQRCGCVALRLFVREGGRGRMQMTTNEERREEE